jgi:HSP20 family protein
MVDIVKNQNGGRTPVVAPSELGWDPMRLMRSFWTSDPFRELAGFPALSQAPGFSPSFDVKETKESYVIKADVPGVQEKDLEISLHGNRLQISGTRQVEKEEKTDTYYTSERSSGSFTRVFSLPDDANAEAIKADLKEGVLTITLGKRADAQAKRIPIKG